MTGRGDPNYNSPLEIRWGYRSGGPSFPFGKVIENPCHLLTFYFVKDGEEFGHAIRKELEWGSGPSKVSPETCDIFVEHCLKTFKDHEVIGPVLKEGLEDAMREFKARELDL